MPENYAYPFTQALLKSEVKAEGDADQLCEGTSAVCDNFVIDGAFASLTSAPQFKIRADLHPKLYDYQRSSVAWMADMYFNKHGGILADDMGMGKTVQVAALLSGLWQSKLGYHFLVAVPVTLIENWRKELSNWADGLPIHVLYGTAKERYDALDGVYKRGGVLLTSYDLVQNVLGDIKSVTQPKAKPKRATTKKRKAAFEDEVDLEPDNGPVVDIKENHHWDVVVIDEAHRVKNASSKAARALRHVNAHSRLLLSGTPLQNNLKELWALMDICMPGLLGNRETFESCFSDPISAGSKRDASEYTVQLKDQLSRQLKTIIAPHFLRRTKDKVEQMRSLPPKTDILVWLKLCPDQERLYKMLLETEVVKQARTNKLGNRATRIAVFRSIRLLQKMCNHPMLSLKDADYFNVLTKWGADANPAPEDGNTLDAEHWDSQALKDVVADTAVAGAQISSKLRFLSVLLPSLQKKGHRCLIFSQSTKMLNMVQMCVLRPQGLKFLRLDGTMKPEERDVKVTKFENAEGISKFFCMCLSIQVGGQGLTLTSADRVIILDPSWNPAVDMQAIDRTHRLGQTKHVVVYRLVGSGSIEDKMLRYQIFKRGVVKTLLEEENQTRYFTQKDMTELFTYGDKMQSFMEENGHDWESGEIINTVTNDVGDMEQNTEFWDSKDLEGFADYANVFSQLEKSAPLDCEAHEKAQEAMKKLQDEEYVAELPVDDAAQKENEESDSNQAVKKVKVDA